MRSEKSVIGHELALIDERLAELATWLAHRADGGKLLIDKTRRVQSALLSLRTALLKAKILQDDEPAPSPGAPSNLREILNNVFPVAHTAIRDPIGFRWHRGRTGASDTDRLHASQSFCLSVWATAFSPEGSAVRQLLIDQLAKLGSQALPESIATATLDNVGFEFSNRSLLNEVGGTPTHLDVVIRTHDVAVAVESKLMEPFGSCSQVSRGACSGAYKQGSDLTTGNDAACRLTIPDGNRAPRRYWEVMAKLAPDGAWPHEAPCPFAGAGFQVMRVIASAQALAERAGTDWRVVYAYPQSFSADPSATIRRIVHRLSPANQARVVTLAYERLRSRLLRSPDEVAQDLGSHLHRRLLAVESQEAWAMLINVPALLRPRKRVGKVVFPSYAQMIPWRENAQLWRHQAGDRWALLIPDAPPVQVRRDGADYEDWDTCATLRIEPAGAAALESATEVIDHLEVTVNVIEPPAKRGGAVRARLKSEDILGQTASALASAGWTAVPTA